MEVPTCSDCGRACAVCKAEAEAFEERLRREDAQRTRAARPRIALGTYCTSMCTVPFRALSDGAMFLFKNGNNQNGDHLYMKVDQNEYLHLVHEGVAVRYKLPDAGRQVVPVEAIVVSYVDWSRTARAAGWECVCVKGG